MSILLISFIFWQVGGDVSRCAVPSQQDASDVSCCEMKMEGKKNLKW